MQFGQPVSREPAGFEYDYFTLPPASPAMLSHSVEVHLAASFSSAGYPDWASSRPELLLLKVKSKPHLPWPPPPSGQFNLGNSSSHLVLKYGWEVHLAASFSSEGYPGWAFSPPELLLLKVGPI